jgi:hypothetical protein
MHPQASVLQRVFVHLIVGRDKERISKTSNWRIYFFSRPISIYSNQSHSMFALVSVDYCCCLLSYLCTPLHLKQKSIPSAGLPQSGFLARQSTHCKFPSIACSAVKSSAFISYSLLLSLTLCAAAAAAILPSCGSLSNVWYPLCKGIQGGRLLWKW